MRLTVLGTATPYPRPDRPCSGYLLETPTTAIWIDAGPGTLAELLRIRPLESLDAIWVSHRHADHTADLLPAYYALRHGSGAPASVPLFAPDGVQERIAAFVGPHAERKVDAALPPLVVTGFGEHRVGDLAIEWAPVQHGVPAFALRVTDGSASLVYSGDCAPCASLVELAEDADVLVCESGAAEARGEGEPAHHTPEDAGRTAAAARAGRLLLTHLHDSLTSAEAIRRAATAFDGPVEVLVPRDVREI